MTATLPETNISSENTPKPKRRVVSQLPFFRGYVMLVVGSVIFVASQPTPPNLGFNKVLLRETNGE